MKKLHLPVRKSNRNFFLTRNIFKKKVKLKSSQMLQYNVFCFHPELDVWWMK